MLNIMRLCLGIIARLFRARHSLVLENLALRQQLAVFKRRHPRTRLTFLDKLFWVAARQIWSDWKRLGKETPFGKPHSEGSGLVLSRARLAGLHHRYDRAA